jgi:hypothetical protein
MHMETNKQISYRLSTSKCDKKIFVMNRQKQKLLYNLFNFADNTEKQKIQ